MGPHMWERVDAFSHKGVYPDGAESEPLIVHTNIPSLLCMCLSWHSTKQSLLKVTAYTWYLLSMQGRLIKTQQQAAAFGDATR